MAGAVSVLKPKTQAVEISGFRQVKLGDNIFYVMESEGGADYAKAGKILSEKGLDFLSPSEASDLTQLMWYNIPPNQELRQLFTGKIIFLVTGWVCFFPKDDPNNNINYNFTEEAYAKQSTLIVGIKRDGPRYLDNEDMKQRLRK